MENGIMAQPNINFEVEIHVAERDSDIYAATIMPFHVTGYADTFDGAVDRVREGLDRLLDEYEADGNLQQFLDESGIEYTVTDGSPDADGW
jgi:hypothetical protein